MKKKILLVVTACMLVLTACGTTQGADSGEQTSEVQSGNIESNSVESTEPEQEVAPSGETEVTMDENKTASFEAEITSEESVSTEAGADDVVLEETEPFYFAATTLADVEVESYAADIREMILNEDWETFVYEISYPIIVDGLNMENATDLTDYIADSVVSVDFLAAIEAETCTEMFNSQQGITMGQEGQIWLGEVQNDDGSLSLQVIEINNMFER